MCSKVNPSNAPAAIKAMHVTIFLIISPCELVGTVWMDFGTVFPHGSGGGVQKSFNRIRPVNALVCESTPVRSTGAASVIDPCGIDNLVVPALSWRSAHGTSRRNQLLDSARHSDDRSEK